MSAFRDLVAAERVRQRRRLFNAALLAGMVGAASVLLLGLSGWFITAAAYAGVAGVAAAQAFNYMLPSAGIRLLAIVRTGARYGERLASHDAAFAALARIRPALFRAIACLPARKALALTTGEATARMVQDVDAVEARFVRLSAPWGLVGSLISGLFLLLIGGWLPALAAIACLAVLLGTASRLAERLRGPGAAIQQVSGALKEEISSLCQAAPELRCYDLEAWAEGRIAAEGHRLGDAHLANGRAQAWFELVNAGMIGLAAALALALAAPAGAPIAALCALSAAMMLDGAAPLIRAMTQRGALEEAERRLEMVMEGACPDEDAVGPVRSLRIASFHAAAGTRTALVGPSGAGKSTLIEQLMALRPVAPGEIFVDGSDLATVNPATLRRSFAWLPQDAMLLSGSVRENLLLARPGASEEMLWNALGDALLDARIKALPMGLDTRIGENGERLSGGERRRLALARTYLSDAPWLLLDEPGEGLDAATQDLLTQRLERRLEASGQGLILVSHHPAMLRICGSSIHLPLDDQVHPPALAA